MTACWEWPWYVNRATGYGQIGRNTYAHRAAFETFVGAIPEGYHVHHACGNRRCVNPEHLRAVSPLEHSHEHRATEACGKCGSTRREQRYRNGKPNGRRCLDCHARREAERTRRKRKGDLALTTGLEEYLGGRP